ncbi:MAG: TetR/AcrR family transcriptional regulator [bacterium]|nr:TetR/AcrR family transcriptional regulator [bacterium]MCP5066878.1 TetR/AcrR family transcriptional regulator [bacterium]
MSAQTQQERRRERRAEARHAILDASEALLSEGGQDAFSIRRLVERCGYTAPTIYQHFGDKDGLLDALLAQGFEQLLEQFDRAPQSGDLIEDLTRLAQIFVRYGIRHPNHYQLHFLPRGQDWQPPEVIDEARTRFEQIWGRLWEEGRLRTGNPQSAAQALWALCHGLISGRIHRPDRPWSKTLDEDAIGALLRGLVEPVRGKVSRRGKRESKC